MARHPERGTAPQRVLPDGDATVELVLLATGGIDGKVVGSTDYRWVHAAPLAKSAPSESADVQNDGSFRFDGLPAGEYELGPVRNGSWGFQQPPSRVTVVAGQRVPVTIKHLTGITLTLKSSEPCESVFLFPRGPITPGGRQAHQPCRGLSVVEIADVQPGEYRACTGYSDSECSPIVVTPQPARQTVQVE